MHEHKDLKDYTLNGPLLMELATSRGAEAGFEGVVLKLTGTPLEVRRSLRERQGLPWSDWLLILCVLCVYSVVSRTVFKYWLCLPKTKRRKPPCY